MSLLSQRSRGQLSRRTDGSTEERKLRAVGIFPEWRSCITLSRRIIVTCFVLVVAHA
jgi:hypothetical protein